MQLLPCPQLYSCSVYFRTANTPLGEKLKGSCNGVKVSHFVEFKKCCWVYLGLIATFQLIKCLKINLMDHTLIGASLKRVFMLLISSPK